MKQSISQILAIHSKVLGTRETIKRLFEEYDVSVTIGGSYALKFFCSEFADREQKDYDFIIQGDKETLDKVRNILEGLCRLGVASKGYSAGCAYHVGTLNGLPIDIILQEGKKKVPCVLFQSVEDVLNAKRGYVEDYIKRGREPREKDLKDIALLEELTDLPF